MSERITSRKNQRIVDAAKYCGHPGDKFLVEGFHTVEMALRDGLVEAIFSLQEYPSPSVPLYLVTPEIIEKLSYTRNPEGIVALCHKKKSKALESSRVLFLDDIQDPGNIGTLLRTALAFGFRDVISTRKCCDPYNPKALLAGQGALFSLNLLLEADGLEEVEALKKEGYYVVGTSLERAISLTDFAMPEKKIALILGNEGQGVRKEILAKTDINIKIPIASIDSLNVGVAGGILMHALALIK